MRVRTTLTAVLALALASTACQPPAQEAAGLSDEDVAAIGSFFEVHTQYALASDWDADAALYTEDAVRLPPNGEPIRGRAAIQSALAQIETVLDYTISVVELDGGGDLAYAWVAYSVTTVIQGSVEPIKSTGKALAILRKQPDSSWMFSRVIWNSDLPLPEGSGN